MTIYDELMNDAQKSLRAVICVRGFLCQNVEFCAQKASCVFQAHYAVNLY